MSGRQGRTTEIQAATEAVYRFLATGEMADPHIMAGKRRPWRDDALLGGGGSANWGLYAWMVAYATGIASLIAAADDYFLRRFKAEMTTRGYACTEGPGSGYADAHLAVVILVWAMTRNAELKALCRRKGRVAWELYRRCCRVDGKGDLYPLLPGPRFDAGTVGPDANPAQGAILAHMVGMGHGYDHDRTIRHPDGATWLVRAVREVDWPDIRQEPLRLEDVRTQAPFTALRWSDGSWAAWTEASHPQDPSMPAVAMRADGSYEVAYPPEWIDHDPPEGGWGRVSIDKGMGYDSLSIRWRRGSEAWYYHIDLPHSRLDSPDQLHTNRLGVEVTGSSWPDPQGMRPRAEGPRRKPPKEPAPRPKLPPPETDPERIAIQKDLARIRDTARFPRWARTTAHKALVELAKAWGREK